MRIEDIRIGASEVAPALGLSPYQSRYAWWAKKTGRSLDEDDGNDATALGNAFEEPVAQLFARAHGVKLWKGHDTRHPSTPWMAATPDFGFDADDAPAETRKRLDVEDGEVVLLEIKTTGLANWRPADVLKREWGEEGSDAIPLHYATQVQQQIHVVDAALRDLGIGFCRRAIVKALIPGRGVPEFVVNGDPGVQHFIVDALTEVVAKHLVGDEPPEPESESDWMLREQLVSMQRRVNGKTLREATADEVALVERWRRAQSVLTLAKTEAAAARAQLVEAIGDSYGLTGAFGRVTYSAGTEAPRLRKAAALDDVATWALLEAPPDTRAALEAIFLRHTKTRRTGARLTPRFIDDAGTTKNEGDDQ